MKQQFDLSVKFEEENIGWNKSFNTFKSIILNFELSSLIKLSKSDIDTKEDDPIDIIIHHDKQVRIKSWHTVTVEIKNNRTYTRNLNLILNKYDQEIIWKTSSNSNYVSVPPNSNSFKKFCFMPLVPLDYINFKEFFRSFLEIFW